MGLIFASGPALYLLPKGEVICEWGTPVLNSKETNSSILLKRSKEAFLVLSVLLQHLKEPAYSFKS
jgi:hypothetical protein